MAKTIRLLATYQGYKRNDIITLDDATADKLLLGGVSATLDLTGGTEAFQPSPGTGLSSGTNLPNPQTVAAGQSATVTIPAGVALSMQGTSNVTGNYQILNPDNTVTSTTPLASGLVTTGVFTRDTRVKIAVTFGSVDIEAVVTGGEVSLGTELAGENPLYGWMDMEAGATDYGGTVLPRRVDQVLGTVGGTGGFLKRLNPIVEAPTDSRVVLKEGNPLPKKLILTHGATASTTTVINTTNNPDAVIVDQYRDHLVRVGTGPYRKILAHAAFAAGAVNSYTLDQPLDAAPAINVPVAIEDPALVVEWLPVGVPVGTYQLPVERYCRGDSWRVSTGATVHCAPSGKKFDNV